MPRRYPHESPQSDHRRRYRSLRAFAHPSSSPIVPNPPHSARVPSEETCRSSPAVIMAVVVLRRRLACVRLGAGGCRGSWPQRGCPRGAKGGGWPPFRAPASSPLIPTFLPSPDDSRRGVGRVPPPDDARGPQVARPAPGDHRGVAGGSGRRRGSRTAQSLTDGPGEWRFSDPA